MCGSCDAPSSASYGRAGGRTLSVEPGLLDLVEQCPIADSQGPRRLYPVPAGLLECPSDGFTLGRLRRPPPDLFERRLWVREGFRRCCGRQMQSPTVGADLGKRDPDHEGIVEDDHSFDQILELSNVAGVAMARETLHHRRRNREPVAAVQFCVALDEVAGQQWNLAGAFA